MSDVTLILNALERGDDKAVNQLLPVVYQELRQLAAQKLSRERPEHPLQATALVHEAYLRLVGSDDLSFKNRAYFFGAVAEAMRRFLIENARRKLRLKHGGDHQKADLMLDDLTIAPPADDLIALDEALTGLAETHQDKADIVKLRCFSGLTIKQAAQVLNMSPDTANRHGVHAKAWLFRIIHS